MKRLGILCASLFLGSLLPAQINHVWVDGVNGSDTNPGTRAKPFKSLTTGVAAYKKNVVVHVLPAVYGPKTTGDFWDAKAQKRVSITLQDYQNLDPRGALPQQFPLRHLTCHAIPLGPDIPQRSIVPAGAFCILLKSGGLGRVFHGRVASIKMSATCMIRNDRFCRRTSPCKCIRQDMSTAVRISAPAWMKSSIRSVPIRVETAASETQNVPPKPQHSSGRSGSPHSIPPSPSNSCRTRFGTATELRSLQGPKRNSRNA